jgi:hypothetical protein
MPIAIAVTGSAIGALSPTPLVVDSYSWGGSDSASLKRITVVRVVDEFSALVVMLLANPQSASATLTCQNGPDLYLTLELAGATMTDYLASGAGDASTEQFTLVSTSITATTGTSSVTI